MTKGQYTEALARSMAEQFPDKGFDCRIAAEAIMDDWLWDEIDKDARRAAGRAADYSYGGTHRHPLDMD